MLECRYRNVRPRGTINVFVESWRDTKKNKKEIEMCGKMDIYENEYWQ